MVNITTETIKKYSKHFKRNNARTKQTFLHGSININFENIHGYCTLLWTQSKCCSWLGSGDKINETESKCVLFSCLVLITEMGLLYKITKCILNNESFL